MTMITFVPLVLVVLGTCVAAQMPSYCGRAPFEDSQDARDDLPHPEVLTHDPITGRALTLVQVQILHRHGDRTCTQNGVCWPNDTAVYECPLEPATVFVDRNVSTLGVPRLYRKVYDADVEPIAGDCFVGQLTTQGFEQHLANGADLRASYVASGFLSPQFTPSEIHLRSTDVPRTIQSVSALVLGLYPASYTPNSLTPVLDIHTRDGSVEDMVPETAAWIALQTAAQNSSGYQQIVAPYLPLIEEIFAETHTNMTDPGALSDCLYAHVCHDYPIPIPSNQLDQLGVGLSAATYYIYTYPTVQEAAQIGMGGYFATVLDRLTRAVNGGAAGFKMFIDSGHDSSVMPFVAGLQTSDGLWASYAVYTTIELYQVGGGSSSFVVRFIYRGKTVQMPYCTQLLCDWSEFSAYLKTLVPAQLRRDSPRGRIRRPRNSSPPLHEQPLSL